MKLFSSFRHHNGFGYSLPVITALVTSTELAKTQKIIGKQPKEPFYYSLIFMVTVGWTITLIFGWIVTHL